MEWARRFQWKVPSACRAHIYLATDLQSHMWEGLLRVGATTTALFLRVLPPRGTGLLAGRSAAVLSCLTTLRRPTPRISPLPSLLLLYFFSSWGKKCFWLQRKEKKKTLFRKIAHLSNLRSLWLVLEYSSAEMGLQIWAHISHPSTAALACVTCIQDLLGVAGSPRALCQGPAVLGGLDAGTPTLDGHAGLDSPTQPCDGGQRLHPSALFPPAPSPISQGTGPRCLQSAIDSSQGCYGGLCLQSRCSVTATQDHSLVSRSCRGG